VGKGPNLIHKSIRVLSGKRAGEKWAKIKNKIIDSLSNRRTPIWP
jgi:hypothetical protein